MPPRPLTHDLIVDILAGLQHRLSEVRITELDGGTFYAVLSIDGQEISSRPSDAIAIALRVGCTVRCADDVLDEAGVMMPDEQESATAETADSDTEVEKFREFLERVDPDDFVTGDEPRSDH